MMASSMAVQVRDELPLDIRLMNATASLVQVLVVMLVLAGLLWWGIRHPWFSLQSIEVSGDLRHINALTLKANVVPRLSGNFFTMDMAQAQKVFEAVPWIRKAQVSREFPGRLHVQLQEHRPIAYWGSEQDSKMINDHGEVFVVNLDEVEDTSLPRFSGPDEESELVWRMHQRLQTVLQPLGQPIRVLSLSPRGSWSVQLGSRVTLEMGRGEEDAVIERVNAFIHSLPVVAERVGRKAGDLEHVDLRHAHGYALRLKGVQTKVPAQKPTHM
jgi:cell division protein FtsQ